MSRVTEDPDEKPLSALVSKRGIKSSADFANFFSALLSDVVEERIQPEVAKVACMAGDKLLAIVKLQQQYGGSKNGVAKVLQLNGLPEEEPK